MKIKLNLITLCIIHQNLSMINNIIAINSWERLSTLNKKTEVEKRHQALPRVCVTIEDTFETFADTEAQACIGEGKWSGALNTHPMCIRVKVSNHSIGVQSSSNWLHIGTDTESNQNKAELFQPFYGVNYDICQRSNNFKTAWGPICSDVRRCSMPVAFLTVPIRLWLHNSESENSFAIKFIYINYKIYLRTEKIKMYV